jgi:hydrogenase maturation protease
MSTVVVGLGNPVLTDDGVGIHVAHAVRDQLPPESPVAIREAYAGGLRLLDQMVGFDHAIIVDALWTGEQRPGTVVRLTLDDLRMSRNSLSLHDLDLVTSLELAREAGMHVPSTVALWGVEIGDANTYSEELTPSVRSAVPEVTARVLEEIDAAACCSVHEEEA